MGIRKIRVPSGLRQLEEELDRIGYEKHGIEPPLKYMPSPEFPFAFEDDEEND